MKPRLEFLDDALIERILAEAHELLMEPGVAVQAPEAVELLAAAGARVEGETVRIPETLVRRALAAAPHAFCLYDRQHNPAVRYGGEAVQFDPGSSCTNVLDPETLTHRPALAADLVRLVKVTEMLPQYAAQSTALVCSDAPPEMGDFYRLFLVLLYSNKPIVTGAFATATTQVMIELLAADSGGHDALRARPRAIFDVCPSAPLRWTEFAGRQLVDLARMGIPVQLISMPLAGATAPVTLLGALVQHTAENLSGLVIHQLSRPGASVVWGGAATIFDMRTGVTRMGAIETAMLAAGFAQIGRRLGLPTHAYLAASDAKIVDAQAGLESGISAVLGALAGVNMISGAGMLDFLACFSAEKLVVDAEAIAMAQRLLQGLQPRTATLATESFAQAGPTGDFLALPATRQWFRQEQLIPSAVIDHGTLRAWQEAGAPDAFARAQARVADLLARYRRPELAPDVERQFLAIVEREARRAELARLPGINA